MKIIDFLKNIYDKHLYKKRYFIAMHTKEHNYESYLQRYYAMMMDRFEYSKGKRLNFENPLTFTEKIQWLKLYDQDPRKGLYSDKYVVRKHIEQIIGKEYLNDLIKINGKEVFYNSKDIDFSLLPNSFVLKCSHASHFNYIIKDKSSLSSKQIRIIKRQLNKWLKIRYAFVNGLELQYELTKPSIIIEKYLTIDGDLPDYKFFCFSGELKFAWMDSGRYSGHHVRDIFNPFNPSEVFNFQFGAKNQFFKSKAIKLPSNFNEMIDIAKKLAEDFSFVRVDLFNVNGKIYFGELTFSSASGFRCPDPKEADLDLGKYIKIDQNKRYNCTKYRKE